MFQDIEYQNGHSNDPLTDYLTPTALGGGVVTRDGAAPGPGLGAGPRGCGSALCRGNGT